MKKINFLSTILCILFAINAIAQSAPINPIQAIIGNDIKTFPNSYLKDNAALIVWSDGSDKPAPLFHIATPKASLTFCVATASGMCSALDETDIVMEPSGETKRVIFNLNSADEFNTRKWHFGTRQRGYKSLVVSNSDRVGIGTDNFPNSFPEVGADNYRLYVKGGIKAEEIKVELCSTSGWCDYVFAKNYKLMPFKKLKTFLQINKHLPNMPSAQNLVANGGFEVSKMITLQQEKIEENTLYIIQLNDKLEKLLNENKELQKRLLVIEKANSK
jgi:hypothetical protein